MAASKKQLKLLVTGGGGMLESTLTPLLRQRGHIVTALSKEELDITDFARVNATIAELAPDLVLHCAAYTQVDKAESEQDEAYLVNYTGTENVAHACGKNNIGMLYVSTDYVFDGTGTTPYKTNDQTCPISIYGKSKLAGEIAVVKNCPNFYIVRTSWLYGPFGRNFVDTIYKLASEKGTIQVVADQVGSPTSTATLSHMIAELIESGRTGVYHATDDGVTSWYEFAREIVKELTFNGSAICVIPIDTCDMPRPAPRPAYSVLDKSDLISVLGRPLETWQEALAKYKSEHLLKSARTSQISATQPDGDREKVNAGKASA
jgi:dTDP-4-dehydrorhamnose reductase